MQQQMYFCLLCRQKITGFKAIFHMDSLNEYLSYFASIRGLCQRPSRVIALNTAVLHFSTVREETLLSSWTLRQFVFPSFVCHSGKHVDIPFHWIIVCARELYVVCSKQSPKAQCMILSEGNHLPSQGNHL